ncbi:DUF4870 domain-containing protein [Thermomonas sp. HDW16]|uniref:DUF4870 domain-containing protein n=1 Tax=Thermomonas sp. HDW16 TaxID=2714945 RepID=UPI0014082DCA|nr:DUF4870 domain-containing protein [Thermomonas sp. HDW16]QIL20253.1 DUF4870 domain-containing protein [Thermomonas sp. HDW16]
MEATNVQILSPSQSERLWAASAHVAALLAALMTSWIAGVAGALAAFGVWMLVRDKSAFAAEHAKEAVNFNLSMLIYACIAALIGVLLLGATVLTLGIGLLVTAPAGLVLLLVVAAIAVTWFVCSVVAAFKAYDGQAYRYPLTIRLFN